jgi:hypothetical protein
MDHRHLNKLAPLLLLPLALSCRSRYDLGSVPAEDRNREVEITRDPCQPATDLLDESSCTPSPSDYRPTNSDADGYAKCISDGGTYELVAATPSSIARIDALERIAVLLWENRAPTVEDFKAARTAYELDDGLMSRIHRRDDLHYPEIPQAEWKPSLDRDKQCADPALASKYAQRCVGPATLRPIIDAAFTAGMAGEGDPNLHAARIKAALVWFSYLSVYKEAYTCTHTAKDCDSSWAYYAGGAQVDGEVLGFAKLVRPHSETTHRRIFDGILAVRCVRDLYSIDKYPTYAELPEEGKQLFDSAWEQLDDALARGLAIVLRQHILAQDDEQCAQVSAANWAFVQIVGPALDHELRERNVAAADELLAIYQLDMPTAQDLDRAAQLIDQAIPCP